MTDEERETVADKVQAFYDLHPYPPPVDDLDGYRRRWQDEGRRRADFHLHWPDGAYRADLQVLVAGCGTSQAAKHALRQPDSQVVGIDFSAESVQRTEALKRKYNLTNLEVYQLPVERVGELGRRFDKIVCTGVLHHLPDPAAGLCALRDVLAPGGAMHLMVYAAYGRAGVYMLQEYCRRLGVGHTEQEIQALAVTLTALPRTHPLARLLGESPDFQRKDALADALLNPQDRAYTVPQLFEFIGALRVHIGPVVAAGALPGAVRQLCADTPCGQTGASCRRGSSTLHVELLRGNMVRHNLIVYRDDGFGAGKLPRFDGDGWLDYTPLRLPETIVVQERLPPGAAAVLINQEHTDPDLFLPVDAAELRLVKEIDGRRSIAAIVQRAAALRSLTVAVQMREQARTLFERLWWYDQVVFDISRTDERGKQS